MLYFFRDLYLVGPPHGVVREGVGEEEDGDIGVAPAAVVLEVGQDGQGAAANILAKGVHTALVNLGGKKVLTSNNGILQYIAFSFLN